LPERWKEIHRKALAGEFLHNDEDLWTQADGSSRWLRWAVHPWRDSHGEIGGIIISVEDITQRKVAERKMRAQLGQLDLLNRITRAIAERQDLKSIFQAVIRSLEDHLPIDFGCACLYDETNNTLIVTSVGVRSADLAMDLAMKEQARIAVEQNGLSQCLKGHLVYEPDISQIKIAFPQRLAQAGLRSLVAAPFIVEGKVFGVLIAARLEAKGFSSDECEFLRQLSEHVSLAAHQAQLHHALQQAYDDLRQTQQAVMQQERLRALGQMASGTAHDINNAISPISLYAQSLLDREPNLSDRARRYLNIIARAIEDVAETVGRMREFYREREPQQLFKPVDLNQLAEQVVDLTQARWSNIPQERGIVIDLRLELGGDLPRLMGIESEIREALTNLIFNAVDAMPAGGTLTVQTRTISASPGSVCVEVRDTGAGMSEETRRRCLEPFFTTKGERGTGLGLAMVYGMMQRHGADIDIESAVGKGTTMRLRFPSVSAGEVESATLALAITPQPLRILVVDDDPVLLSSLSDILETDGHVVVAANGGQQGIDAFNTAQAENRPFSVVITDLGMPYVDGRNVAKAVKRASPSTPVVLLTGWGQRLMDENEVPERVDCVLSKPPKLAELRVALVRCSNRGLSEKPPQGRP
jgi:signal transduction histidine kinase/ActR/RegA family two-component response regulator